MFSIQCSVPDLVRVVKIASAAAHPFTRYATESDVTLQHVRLSSTPGHVVAEATNRYVVVRARAHADVSGDVSRDILLNPEAVKYILKLKTGKVAVSRISEDDAGCRIELVGGGGFTGPSTAGTWPKLSGLWRGDRVATERTSFGKATLPVLAKIVQVSGCSVTLEDHGTDGLWFTAGDDVVGLVAAMRPATDDMVSGHDFTRTQR